MENRSERILSSAIVASTLVVARYPPMIPVRMAATAVTAMTARPKGPMIASAAWKVGTASTPLRPPSPEMYSCQEEKPSGMAATLISAIET